MVRQFATSFHANGPHQTTGTNFQGDGQTDANFMSDKQINRMIKLDSLDGMKSLKKAFDLLISYRYFEEGIQIIPLLLFICAPEKNRKDLFST